MSFIETTDLHHQAVARSQRDQRNQIDQITREEQSRTSMHETKTDQGQTQEMLCEEHVSTETVTDQTAQMKIKIVKTSLQENLMKNLCQYHQTVIRHQGFHGHVSIAPM